MIAEKTELSSYMRMFKIVDSFTEEGITDEQRVLNEIKLRDSGVMEIIGRVKGENYRTLLNRDRTMFTFIIPEKTIYDFGEQFKPEISKRFFLRIDESEKIWVGCSTEESDSNGGFDKKNKGTFEPIDNLKPKEIEKLVERKLEEAKESSYMLG